MRNREKNRREKKEEGGRSGWKVKARRRRNDGRSKEVRDKTRREDVRRRQDDATWEGGKGVHQESLCNRSFLLFPGVAAEGESSLGEVNLDSRCVGGVDRATRTGRDRVASVENRDGGGAGNPPVMVRVDGSVQGCA